MLADGAQQAAPGGKLYILGGQWDRLMVPAFPAQHPTMAVVLVLRIEYSEALDRHQLEVELTLDGESKNVKAVGQVVTGQDAARSWPHTHVKLPGGVLQAEPGHVAPHMLPGQHHE